MFHFYEILSDSVNFGNIFEISGTSADDAKNIKLFLSSGVLPDQGSVLSIDLNYETNKVIFNNHIELNVNLTSGEDYEIRILVGADRFYIAYNETAIGECIFMAPLSMIRSVIIFGDIHELTKVNHLNVFPTNYPKIASDEECLAFESYIPNRFSPGHIVVISGVCNEEFIVMFTENGSNRQVIHFNVRFDEATVIMNTENFVDGWNEDEIRSTVFPFEIGRPFKVAFAFTPDKLKVAVDGNNLMDFEYSHISLEDDETLWGILSGFRVKNRNDETTTTISSVEHIKMMSNCSDFEKYSIL